MTYKTSIIKFFHPLLADLDETPAPRLRYILHLLASFLAGVVTCGAVAILAAHWRYL